MYIYVMFFLLNTVYILIYICVYIWYSMLCQCFSIRDVNSLTWDSNPRPSDFRSEALPTDLASLTQGWSSTLDVYPRSDIEAHKLVPGFLAAEQVPAPPEVTLYLSSTSTLAQFYLNFGILSSSVASLSFFFEVSQDVMLN